jgi:hypothetical protein
MTAEIKIDLNLLKQQVAIYAAAYPHYGSGKKW